ncbi:MAG: glycolate oxidase subunit GlcE [Gammaproteobacteria bacterium]|nr:glycolate oxidase subunit GlcE [Gammaproteobacteria bacterium]
MAWTAPADPAGDAAASVVLRELADSIRASAAASSPLAIVGGGTKTALIDPLVGTPLPMYRYRGVLAYEPAELVIEARAGTPLAEIEALLAAHGQMLACEPPRCGPASTIGGVVAAGLSGPARPWAGALRDLVLGVGLLSTSGELLRFGGRVMKNVAGYDVSRLVCGAWGTLGPIATVALRVAPRPERCLSLRWSLAADEARRRMLELSRAPWPLTGVVYDGEYLRVRLAGTMPAVGDACVRLAPAAIDDDDAWWLALRDLRVVGCMLGTPLWRVSAPPAATIDAQPMRELIDWGGAQRWWTGTALAATDLHARVHAAAGTQAHAQPMFAAPRADQPPLSPVQRTLQRRLRSAFDADRLFNRGCSRVAD